MSLTKCPHLNKMEVDHLLQYDQQRRSYDPQREDTYVGAFIRNHKKDFSDAIKEKAIIQWLRKRLGIPW